MVVGVVQEVFRALAGDLNNSRSVSRPLRWFFSFSFAFVYSYFNLRKWIKASTLQN